MSAALSSPPAQAAPADYPPLPEADIADEGSNLNEHFSRDALLEYEQAWIDFVAAPPAPPAPLPGKRERALFQAWARDRHWNLSLRADGERYMSESTQEGWYAWKGRAALSAQAAPEYRTPFDEAPSTFNQEDAAPADYPPPQKYDDVLVPFVAAMRKELHANSGKGDRPGWLAMDANTALLEVYWHAAKLSAAVKNNDGPAIQEHSADVANMAMMVLDICGGLAWVEVAADRTQRSGVSADPMPDKKLWLWKNFVDGRPEYWAFDNPYPCRMDCWDPQTLGEPCGYALLKPSREGRTDWTEEKVLHAIKNARPAKE